MSFDKQEAFDKAAKGVIAQGTYAFEGGACSYHTYSGHKCGVGHLLPEDPRGNNWHSCGGIASGSAVRIREALGVSGDGPAVAYLQDLQRAHDKAFTHHRYETNGDPFMDAFIGNMRAVAATYGLNADALAI